MELLSFAGVIMNKEEHTVRGLKVMLLEGAVLDLHKNYLLSAIENYANMNGRMPKIVFFNYDDDGQEEGVTFFYRKDF